MLASATDGTAGVAASPRAEVAAKTSLLAGISCKKFWAYALRVPRTRTRDARN
jgi:hypothetical protein